MNWDTLKDGLHAWFAAVTGLTVVWADQAAPRPAYPYGLLKVVSTGTVGTDENRYTYNAGGGVGADMDVNTTGNRPFTLNCQVLNSQDDSSSLGHQETAQHYLSLAQVSLGKQSYLDTLATAGVAYYRRDPILPLDEVMDGRFISRASMAVFMGAAENSDDTATTYIKTTEVSGEFDGTQTPGSLDFDDETFGVT